MLNEMIVLLMQAAAFLFGGGTQAGDDASLPPLLHVSVAYHTLHLEGDDEEAYETIKIHVGRCDMFD